MKKLKINLEDLVSSFTFDSEDLAEEYFDTFTGEIINIPSTVMEAAEGGEEDDLDDWEKELLEEAIAILEDEEERYLITPTIESSYFYDAMVDFTNKKVENDEIRAKLNSALNERQPMRSWKTIILTLNCSNSYLNILIEIHKSLQH